MLVEILYKIATPNLVPYLKTHTLCLIDDLLGVDLRPDIKKTYVSEKIGLCAHNLLRAKD